MQDYIHTMFNPYNWDYAKWWMEDEREELLLEYCGTFGVSEEEVELLRFVQNKLFVIGSYLATDVSFAELRDASKLKVDDVLRIEQRIDELDAQLPKITNFILPGGTQAASVAHICRTICRRAERRICELASQCSVDSNLLSFMNRLSDYLFVFARFNNYKTSGNEIYWDKNC